MGSQFLEILRQGVWASLTGGWFFDPRQGHVANILHLYLWLLLIVVPFCLYMFAPTGIVAGADAGNFFVGNTFGGALWACYVALVGGLFTAVKILNVRLHRLFDTGEALREETLSCEGAAVENGDALTSPVNEQQRSVTSAVNADSSRPHSAHHVFAHRRNRRGFVGRERSVELELLASRPDGETPPVQCSSRNSLANLGNRVDSIEYISLNVRAACADNTSVDLGVQLARGSSGGSSAGSQRSSLVRRDRTRSTVGGVSTQSVRSCNLSHGSAFSPDSHRKSIALAHQRQHVNTDTASTTGVVAPLSLCLDEPQSQASGVLSTDAAVSLSSSTSLHCLQQHQQQVTHKRHHQQVALPCSSSPEAIVPGTDGLTVDGVDTNGESVSHLLSSETTVSCTVSAATSTLAYHFSPVNLQASSADPLIKSPLTGGSSAEFGFISQDPSVARARTQTSSAAAAAAAGANAIALLGEGRRPVRRAHSEMETSASAGTGATVGGHHVAGGGNKPVAAGCGVGGQPPSHPVSLEAISSQPLPPGAVPRRSMDYIRKDLSEETIQEDEIGSVLATPIQVEDYRQTRDYKQQARVCADPILSQVSRAPLACVTNSNNSTVDGLAHEDDVVRHSLSTGASPTEGATACSVPAPLSVEPKQKKKHRRHRRRGETVGSLATFTTVVSTSDFAGVASSGAGPHSTQAFSETEVLNSSAGINVGLSLLNNLADSHDDERDTIASATFFTTRDNLLENDDETYGIRVSSTILDAQVKHSKDSFDADYLHDQTSLSTAKYGSVPPAPICAGSSPAEKHSKLRKSDVGVEIFHTSRCSKEVHHIKRSEDNFEWFAHRSRGDDSLKCEGASRAAELSCKTDHIQREEDAQSSSSSFSSPDESTPSLKKGSADAAGTLRKLRQSRQGPQESGCPAAASSSAAVACDTSDAWQCNQIRRRLLEILSRDDFLVSGRDLQRLKEELLCSLADNDVSEDAPVADSEDGRLRSFPADGSAGAVSAAPAIDHEWSENKAARFITREESRPKNEANFREQKPTLQSPIAADSRKASFCGLSDVPGFPGNVNQVGLAAATSSGDVSCGSPPSYLLASVLSTVGTHLARSHDDTSPGAVHCFRDEDGNWQVYAFNESGKASSPKTYLAAASSSTSYSLQQLQQHQHRQRRRKGHIPRQLQQQQRDMTLTFSGAGDSRVTANDCTDLYGSARVATWDTTSQGSSSSGATLMVSEGPSWHRGGPVTPGADSWIDPASDSWGAGGSITSGVRDGRLQQQHYQTASDIVRGSHQHVTGGVSGVTLDATTSTPCAVPGTAARPQHLQSRLSRDHRQQLSDDFSSIQQPTPPHIPSHPSTSFRGSRSGLGISAPFGGSSSVGGDTGGGHSSLSYLCSQRGIILSHPSGLEPSFGGGVCGPVSCLGDVSMTRPRQYYMFNLFPWSAVKGPQFKISFDRLTLLAVLDGNVSLAENFFSVLLAVLVAFLGACCLQKGLFVEMGSICFCFVMASCQYSLLKSVQPDAASPTHGYNHIVLYSRPVYFCLGCAGLLLSQGLLDSSLVYPDIVIYNWRVFTASQVAIFRNFLIGFLLSFPILFSVGMLPQVNTFLTYFCEQIDMHLFGGAAATGPVSAVYCLSRSVVLTGLLFGICYSSLQENQNPANNIAFSIFCGLLVTTSYHLSRCQSDPTVIWQLVGIAFEKVANSWKKNSQSSDADTSVLREHNNTHADSRPDRGDSVASVAATVNDSSISRHSANVAASSRKTSVETNRIPEGITQLRPDSSDCPTDPESWKTQEFVDPLPQQMRNTVLARLKTDAIHVTLLSVFVFALHVSTMFSVLQPYLSRVLYSLALIWGVLLHYFLPQARKHLPWLCFSTPFLKSREHYLYDSTEPAHLMWFERVQVYMWFVEKNAIYPLVILSALTVSLAPLIEQFGLMLGCLVLVVASMRCLRGAFTDPSKHFVALAFTLLIFKFDFRDRFREPILVNFFAMLLATHKLYELLLKLRFVITYIAPWQITWGSAFHAFAQPFSVPHSAMLFMQAIVSSILSAPLSPVLGSAIFFTSYVRPVKFWERDYNTKRVDHSNTRLSCQLERNPGGSDENNLNSIFYEHLTRSLQKSLCGDLMLGRWGSVSQGDCFVLASDNLNCLVHIIELANGLVTFQLRGLEFRGTYCQQREVEAMTEEVRDNTGCCCCEPGYLPGMLSANAAFNQRWLAWEVSAAKYISEGYSISDNSAVPLLQVFELRRALMTYYVKAVIYYAVTNPKLEAWLNNPNIQEALAPTLDKHYAELDPVFTMNNDDDFDCRVVGISRNSFCKTYLSWIQYCVQRATATTRSASPNGIGRPVQSDRGSLLVSFCLALSVLARRALGSASHNTLQSVDYLLFGLHALFKGDIRIACVRDEWVFHDMDLINKVVAPAVRMAFKLHQDHIMSSEDLEKPKDLFDAIELYTATLVISHEADPVWRNAVLSSVQSLLALRHVADENSDDYKIITLNKRFLDFRVVKVNRECVRGLWAGQQQELVYLRNRNPERGSIQNAKQALRNIINSSCDQPIGYPIYVSPLTTSFAETSPQLCELIGGSLSLSVFQRSLCDFFSRLKIRCGEGCSSGGAARRQLDASCGLPSASVPIGSLTGCSAPASLSGSITRGGIGSTSISTGMMNASVILCPLAGGAAGGNATSFSGAGVSSIGAATGAGTTTLMSGSASLGTAPSVGGVPVSMMLTGPPKRSHSSGSHLTCHPFDTAVVSSSAKAVSTAAASMSPTSVCSFQQQKASHHQLDTAIVDAALDSLRASCDNSKNGTTPEFSTVIHGSAVIKRTPKVVECHIGANNGTTAAAGSAGKIAPSSVTVVASTTTGHTAVIAVASTTPATVPISANPAFVPTNVVHMTVSTTLGSFSNVPTAPVIAALSSSAATCDGADGSSATCLHTRTLASISASGARNVTLVSVPATTVSIARNDSARSRSTGNEGQCYTDTNFASLNVLDSHTSDQGVVSSLAMAIDHISNAAKSSFSSFRTSYANSHSASGDSRKRQPAQQRLPSAAADNGISAPSVAASTNGVFVTPPVVNNTSGGGDCRAANSERISTTVSSRATGRPQSPAQENYSNSTFIVLHSDASLRTGVSMGTDSVCNRTVGSLFMGTKPRFNDFGEDSADCGLVDVQKSDASYSGRAAVCSKETSNDSFDDGNSDMTETSAL